MERGAASEKKVRILLVFLCVAVLGGFALTAMNVNHDFLQLSVFYHGYMGRKLLIKANFSAVHFHLPNQPISRDEWI
jgi:hypothetical protein